MKMANQGVGGVPFWKQCGNCAHAVLRGSSAALMRGPWKHLSPSLRRP